MIAALLSTVLAADGGAVEVFGTYPGDQRMWEGIVSRAPAFSFDGLVVAAVAPHHLIDGDELAGFWNGLLSQRPSVVVIVAPDHFGRGRGVTVGRALLFPTVFGPLEVDAALADRLGGDTNDSSFVGEHSVHVHAPFLSKLSPKTRFVPVLLRWQTPRAELERLVAALAESLPADALVVGSVDFSHYQPAPWASFHDEPSHATLTGGFLDELFEQEVDSPEALFVALRFAQERGARRVARVLHTNSQRKREALLMDSTSHHYVIVTRGEPAPQPSISVAIAGEGAPFGVVGPWRWQPDAGARELKRLRGTEDRFFVGADATVFNLSPGEQWHRSVRGQRLVVKGVSLRERPAPIDGDCVIVIAHRGQVQGSHLRDWLSVADVVVGRGFGASTPIEQLDGGVVVESLGAFVGSAPGRMLGITCAVDGVRVRSVPLTHVGGLPQIDPHALERERGLEPL